MATLDQDDLDAIDLICQTAVGNVIASELATLAAGGYGYVYVSVVDWNGTAVAAADASGNIPANVTMWRGTQPAVLVSDMVPANVALWLGTAPAALDANGNAPANVIAWQGSAVDSAVDGNPPAHVVAFANGAITATAIAASALDGKGDWLLSSGYTAPDNVSVTAIKAKTDNLPAAPAAVGSAMTLANGAVTANAIAASALNGKGDWLLASTWTTFVSGITSLANWLRAMLRKDTADATAKTEINTGGGAYDEATDSQEAIRDNQGAGGLTAQQTRDAMKLAPTAGAAAAGSVDALLAAIPTTGSGAYTITLTVNDGTNPIAGAIAAFTSGVTRHEATTSALGVATFGLDAGAWTLSLSKSGYTYTPASYTVSATASITRSMAAVAVTPSADPATTTGYLTTRNGQNTVLTAQTITFRLVDGPGTAGHALKGHSAGVGGTFTATSDGAGMLQVTLLRGGKYQMRWGTGGAWTDFTAGTDTTYELPELVGPG
jgi:hypothetical protein